MTSSRPSQAGGNEDDERERVLAPASKDWGVANFAPPPTEALASPAIVWVRHSQVLGDPFNIRDSLPAVQRLAWSIYQHGLLENLLFVETTPEQRLKTGCEYELRAGSRRFEAIRRLIDGGVEPPPNHPDRELGVRWYWPADKPIPGLVLGSEGHYEHLLENVERSDPHPWEVGRRINEILGAGVSTRELGSRLGRSSGWITRYSHLGRGLAQELVLLIRRERADVRLGELAQLAAIRDPFGDPDPERQIAAYRARREKKRRRPRRIDPHSFRATQKRLQYLRGDMPVPSIIRPIVTAVVEYLEGGDAPKFKVLEQRLFDHLQTHSPLVDTDDGHDPEPVQEAS